MPVKPLPVSPLKTSLKMELRQGLSQHSQLWDTTCPNFNRCPLVMLSQCSRKVARRRDAAGDDDGKPAAACPRQLAAIAVRTHDLEQSIVELVGATGVHSFVDHPVLAQ